MIDPGLSHAGQIIGTGGRGGSGSAPAPTIQFHPLYRELKLNSTTNQALVTVAELAKYLQAFVADPTLPGVLADLRSDKYPSTLFELAMAHRWRLVGANVRLQPAKSA